MRTGVLAPGAVAVLAVAAIVGLAALATVHGPAAVADPTVPPTSRSTSSPRSSGQPCAPSLQAEIDAAPARATLDLGGCTYLAGATIDKPLTIVGATIRVPPGKAGITVEADDVTLDGLVVTGAQSNAFVFEEIGVLVLREPSAPVRRLRIRNSTIAAFGGFGTYLRNVADLRLEGNDVHDVVYAGLMILSGTGGMIDGNVVRRIGVAGSEANDGNAYGIVLTKRGEGEPASSGFLVDGNTVEDVPTWHAIDTHGGNTITFSDNTIRRSMRGIFVTTDEDGTEPTNIAIVDNELLSPAPVTTNVAAVTLYRARVVAILRNTVTGWGEGNFLRDFEDQSTRVVLNENTVEP